MFVSHYEETASDESPPDYNRMSQLNYLDAVMKETLRIHSPAPVVRTCTKDMTIKRGQRTLFIPEGMSLFMFPLYMQLMEDSDFRPERFLVEENNGESACTYMPFSIGPRGCLGAPMAVAEVKAILCHILRTYTGNTQGTRKMTPWCLVGLLLQAIFGRALSSISALTGILQGFSDQNNEMSCTILSFAGQHKDKGKH